MPRPPDPRIGTWIDPLNVVENGGLHQHGVSTGVAYLSASAPTTKFLAIDTLDAAVVDPATAAEPAEMFPQPLSPLTGPVLGFDVQLMQNGACDSALVLQRDHPSLLLRCSI